MTDTNKVNEANIRKIIDWIKKDQAVHFKMGGWVSYLLDNDDRPTKYVECGTAFCIGGYANLLRLQEAGEDPLAVVSSEDEDGYYGNEFLRQFVDQGAAAAWMGLDCRSAHHLFMAITYSNRGIAEIDSLEPSRRAEVAIDVLENLIATGEVDWDKSLDKFGVE